MLLRASGKAEGEEIDLEALTRPEGAARSGVPQAEPLLAFAQAVVTGDEAALATAREELRRSLGPEAVVDAAAVVGNFERMNRVADATGIALDAPVRALSADIRQELGLEGFVSAANTPESGRLAGILGHLVRPVAWGVLRVAGALRSRS